MKRMKGNFYLKIPTEKVWKVFFELNSEYDLAIVSVGNEWEKNIYNDITKRNNVFI